MKSIPKRLLIVKNRNLGDAVMGLSSVAWLKSIWPETSITYAIPSWISPLFDSVQTSADSIVGFDLKTLKGYWDFWRWVRSKKFDVVFELHQAGRTRSFFKYLCRTCIGAYYFHNHHDKKGNFVLDQGIIKAAIQRDLDGAWSIARDRINSASYGTPSYLDWCPIIQGNFSGKGDIVFGISATRQAKMWPPEYFIELMHHLRKAGMRQRFLVPLSLSSMDSALYDHLQGYQLPTNIEFVRVPLKELILSLAGGECYIGNDSGLKHLCIAMGMKSYTFFGPENPLEWHPYNPKDHPYYFLDNLECRTTDGHYCGKDSCDSLRCLREIRPDDVAKKFFDL